MQVPGKQLRRDPRARAKLFRRRRAVLGGLVMIVLAGAAALIETEVPSSPHKAPPSHVAARTRSKGNQRPHEAGSQSYLGSVGVVSPGIVSENDLPGTSSWQISPDSGNGYVQGFADANYAAIGDHVGLYVSTSAPAFYVVAYRMGYYQGLGARQIWSSSELPGRIQPPCPISKGVNMVTCDNWSRSLDVSITNHFVPGEYLFKLTGTDGHQSYVPLTIWDPNSTSAYLVMNRSLTEEGWNTYGGYSFYQGEGPCILDSIHYPVCNRARVVSFDRPYSDGNGASDFMSNEYPLVRYMEENGLDVSYVTDVTIDEHPTVLLQHRALLSLGHDELWTYSERQAAQTALSDGVNVAFFGAAAVLRHARLQSSPLGADREEVDYRNDAEDPLNGKGDPMEVTGNTWSSPPANWPESGFTGEIYSGYLEPGFLASFVVEDPSAWIFKGTGLKAASSLPGVVESDIDHVDPSQPIPSDVEVLGHSPVSIKEAYTNQGSWSGYTYSDMTYYTDQRSNAGVFDSGTVNWINALTTCPASVGQCSAQVLGEITGNLLWLFGQGPAGRLEPSVSNLKAVVPSGS